jgi:hypothetical protein
MADFSGLEVFLSGPVLIRNAKVADLVPNMKAFDSAKAKR